MSLMAGSFSKSKTTKPCSRKNCSRPELRKIVLICSTTDHLNVVGYLVFNFSKIHEPAKQQSDYRNKRQEVICTRQCPTGEGPTEAGDGRRHRVPVHQPFELWRDQRHRIEDRCEPNTEVNQVWYDVVKITIANRQCSQPDRD